MKFSTIMSELEQLKNAAAGEVERCAEMLSAAEKARDKAENEALAAFDSMDVSAYHAAQEAARNAADTIQMCRLKINGAETAPLITEAEYKAKVAEIRAELDAAVNAAKRSIVSDIQHIIDTAEEIGASVKEGNALLLFLQREIFKDPAFMRGSREEYSAGYPLLWLAEDLRSKDIYKDYEK